MQCNQNAQNRPVEIEEISNLHIIHVLADRVVPFCVKYAIKPNHVSLTGMAAGLLAGLAYFFSAGTPWLIFAGFALMILWHICDGADGKLARLTGQSSDFGRFIDGICDYASFGAVYIAMCWNAILVGHSPWVVLLTVAAGAAHAIQAAAYEKRREEYLRRKNGNYLPPASETGSLGGLVGSLVGLYGAVQRLSQSKDAAVDRSLRQARDMGPAMEQNLWRAYRDSAVANVKNWGLLSANKRTIAIFLFHLFGWPLGYFWFVLLGLSGLMLFLKQQEKQLEDRFLTQAKTLKPIDV